MYNGMKMPKPTPQNLVSESQAKNVTVAEVKELLKLLNIEKGLIHSYVNDLTP